MAQDRTRKARRTPFSRSNPNRTIGLALCILVLCSLTGRSGALQSPGGGAFASVGPQGTRGYFSQLPFERIDMVNGNLTMTFTDLVLPGGGGMDLRIARTYRHQRGATDPMWSYSFTDAPLGVYLGDQYPGVVTPSLLMADGSKKKLHLGPDPPFYLTTDFWRWDQSALKLYLPDGRVASYYQPVPYNPFLRLQKVQDPFGNEILANWGASPSLPDNVVQTVTGDNGTQTRTVTFNGSGFTYDNKTWSQSAGPNNSTVFQPPAGPPTSISVTGFDSEQDPTGTVAVTLSAGGTVTYEFTGDDGRSRVVSRTTGGRAIAGGTWNFGFETSGPLRTATVTTPGGRVLTYTHTFSTGPDDVDWLLTVRSLTDGLVTSSTQWEYNQEVSFIANKPLKAVSKQVIVQDGVTFTTEYEYNTASFSDFLRPKKITESASNHSETRVTNRTFEYGFAGYNVTKVASQTVTVGSESFGTSSSYEPATGFMHSQMHLGMTTQFGRDGAGNPVSATDPGGHVTIVPFQWGVPAAVTNAYYAEVASRLLVAKNPDQARAILSGIAAELMQGGLIMSGRNWR